MNKKDLLKALQEKCNTLEKENHMMKSILSEKTERIIMLERGLKYAKTLVFNINFTTFNQMWVNDPGFFYELLGYHQKSDIFDFNFNEFRDHIYPEDLMVVDKMKSFLIENRGKSYSGMFRIRHKNGDYKWVYSEASVKGGEDITKEPLISGIIAAIEGSLYNTEQLEAIYKETMFLKTGKLPYQLTLLEVRIGKLIIDGFKNREIADMLNISLSTFNSHKKDIFIKTRANNAPSLARYFCTHGLY